jgi:hypothetical protein
MLNRWTLHRGAVSHWWNDGFTTQPTSSLLAGTPSTVDSLVDLLTLRLLGVRFRSQDRTAILNFLAATGPLTVASVIGQRLDALVTLILSSPYALQR